MNKNILLFLTVFICHTTVFCQVRMTGNIIPITNSQASLTVSTFEVGRALGDTLMYFPLPGVILLDTNNQNNFALVTEDVDGLNTNNDIFIKMMENRILFLSGEVNLYSTEILKTQILYLESLSRK